MKTMTAPRPANKGQGLNYELATITPAVATQWLEQNTSNRPLSKMTVHRFASDLKNNRWKITGEAIKFCEDGTLLDGQHRLAACVKADVPMTTIVVYGLPRETQDVMDSGKPRRLTDVMAMHGHANTSAIQTALRLLINEREGRSAVGGGGAITTADGLATLAKHSRLPLYVPAARSLPRGISTGMVGYVRYVTSTFCGGAIDADAMIAVLKTGIPSYDGDAIHKFRERMIGGYVDTMGSHQSRVSVFYTFKDCWNKFVKKQPVKILRWSNENVAIDRLDLKDL